jgi:hypothetical protein
MPDFATLHGIRAVVETFPLGEVNEVVSLVKVAQSESVIEC